MSQTIMEGFALSSQQKQLWQLSREGRAGAALCGVLLEGEVRKGALLEALRVVVDRHEILRTTFHHHAGVNLPVQVISDEGEFVWHESDLSALGVREQGAKLEEAFAAEGLFRFDLEQGPLLRLNFFTLSERRHFLIVNISSLCADAQTLQNFVREVSEAYAAAPQASEPEPIQYADFVTWQLELPESEEAKEGLAFWEKKDHQAVLAQTIPYERRRREGAGFEPDCATLSLDGETVGCVEAEAKRLDVPVDIFLQSCWAVLLWRLTGQEELTVANCFDGRKYDELRDAVGHFAQWLPITCRIDGRQSFRDVLEELGRASASAHEWQEYATADSAAHTAPFAFDSRALPPSWLAASLTWSPARLAAPSPHATLLLRLLRRPHAGALECRLHFDASRLSAQEARRLLAAFARLTGAAARRPLAPVASLDVVGRGERRHLLRRLNRTRRDFGHGPSRLEELVSSQAARHPARVAVVSEGRRLSYAELEERAESLALRLRRRGVRAGDLVGVMVERSEWLVVALLGALKAGAGYVPVEAGQPAERLRAVLGGAGVRCVVTRRGLWEGAELSGEAVYVDEVSPEEEGDVAGGDGAGASSVGRGAEGGEGVAYVIHTSGSTGTPKGVVVEHRQLLNYISAVKESLDLPEGASYATVSTFAADLGHTMIFPALCGGGTLHIVTTECASDPQALADYFGEHQIDCLKIVPSHLQALQSYAHPERLLPRQRLVLGGEAATWSLIEQLRSLNPACRIFNHYGPTETTVGVITYEVTAGALGDVDGARQAATLPLGRPLANTQIYLLDATLEPVPFGCRGEVYVGGSNVTRGYLNRPDATAERFIPDPFGQVPGARLYRTGDQARYLPDGSLEFLGRADNQVKYHGFRVELNEIRLGLNRHPQISDSVVLLKKNKSGREVLAAFYVSRQELPVNELRELLAQSIIEEIIPNAFVHLQKLPLTANGKVDTRALPDVDEVRQGAKRVAARTPVEEVVAAVWGAALGVEHVNPHDNFFELGGHSLLATQVISRLREAFQVELPLRDMFESPTVAAHAECIERALKAGSDVRSAPPLRRVSREQPLPLSFAQHRLWFIDQLEPGNHAYNMLGAVRFEGRLDVPALEESLNKIVERHEALRTTFATVDGQPVQVIAPSLRLPLGAVEVNGRDAAERQAEVLRLAKEESRRPFDLSRGPLLRASLARLDEEAHVLLLTFHHIVSDAWSIGVFARELAACYEAFATGSPLALPPPPIQYADFAHWQRRWLRGETLEAGLDYWKRQLAGAPPSLELPTDRPRPEVQTFRGARHAQVLPPALAVALKSLGRQEGSTLFMTLVAAFKVLLHRHTNQHDIVIGTDIANRNRQELEDLIGFFVNHPVLRTDLSGNPSFRELLKRVREVTLGAYAHQDVPFEKIVGGLRTERSLSHMPIFQVMLVLRNTPMPPLQLRGLKLSLLDFDNETSKFDIALFMEETAEGLAAVWNYSTDLFEPATIERLAAQFEQLLVAVAARPDAELSELAVAGLPAAGSAAARFESPAVVPAEATWRKPGGAYVAPRTEVEKTLAEIWAQVLGVESVGLNDNFFELGGDSVLSIQVIARAGQRGIRLTPKQFFQRQTLAELALVAGTTPKREAEQGAVTGEVPLTPIQRRFLERNLPEPQHFSQAVSVEAGQPLDASLLEKAVRELIAHHDALRLKFVHTEAGWRQFNSAGEASVPFHRFDFSGLAEGEQQAAVEDAVEGLQRGISLADGCLVKVAHFDLGARQPQLLAVTIHHLAVDVVSWRILMEDLQTAYRQLGDGEGVKLPAKTTSFKRWSERLAEFVRTGGFREDAAYWSSELRRRPAPLPVDGARHPNLLPASRTVTVSLDAEETRALLQDVPQAYHTQINDALLTALAQVLTRWARTRSLLVDLEGHGREEIFEDVDLSRTVGWFTSLFPVLLDLGEAATVGNELKLVKEKLRGVPQRGLSFGLLRYLGGDAPDAATAAELASHPQAEVSFNYLGQLDHSKAEASAFGRVKESRNCATGMGGERTHLLEIDALVSEGRLRVNWTYGEQAHRRETVEALAGQFVEALRALISHCRSPEVGGFTPSDFPEAELTQDELDSLLCSLG